MQAREDRLDHGVARGRVRPAAVDVGDEEVARGGRGGGEDAHLREDHLGSGLQVRFAVGWAHTLITKQSNVCVEDLLFEFS